MRVFHNMVIRKKPPSKRCHIRSKVDQAGITGFMKTINIPWPRFLPLLVGIPRSCSCVRVLPGRTVVPSSPLPSGLHGPVHRILARWTRGLLWIPTLWKLRFYDRLLQLLPEKQSDNKKIISIVYWWECTVTRALFTIKFIPYSCPKLKYFIMQIFVIDLNKTYPFCALEVP